MSSSEPRKLEEAEFHDKLRGLYEKDPERYAYYTSNIGIHQELRYKGNVFIKEFVGCQTVDGKDCQYCGQKHLP